MSIRLAVLGWFVAWGCCWAAVPPVTNVQAAQRWGTPYVDIGYDLSGSGTDLSVTVAVSTNGGAAYFTPASGLSGDVGRGVAQGPGKKIVWNAGAALSPALYSNVRVKVAADDNPAPEGMVLIPAGTNSGNNPLGTGESYAFNRYPQTYSLTVDAFYMDATEVTKAQWDSVYTWAVAHGYGFDNVGSGKAADHPVLMVNWYDCAKWCNARSEKDRRTPCYTVGGSVYRSGQNNPDSNLAANGYRLPTNTEWEYAARGGLSGRRFPWGDTIDHTRANYNSDWIPVPPFVTPSGDIIEKPSYEYDTGYKGYDTRYSTGDPPYTSPSGSFAANGYGLYDMAGNVGEWCNTDASNFGRAMAVRDSGEGGVIHLDASTVRCGFILWMPPGFVADIGFRSVCR